MLIENDFIRDFTRNFSRSGCQLNGLLESDAELIQLDHEKILAITTDNIVEEIKTGLYSDPVQLGWMAVTVNMSDLAAVGADPFGVLITINFPESGDTEFLMKIEQGISKACAKYQIHVLGGDTNESLDLLVGGVGVGLIQGQDIIMRKGASPGDILFATGTLGAGGYYALNHYFPSEGHSFKFFPKARINEGKIIRQFGSSCIDTSDGFFPAISNLMDINHNGFHLVDDLNYLVNENIVDLLETRGIPPWYLLAGPHGEFELLFTVNRSNVNDFLKSARKINWTPLCIGEVITDPLVHFEIQGKDLKCKPDEIANLYSLCKGGVKEYIDQLNTVHKSWNL